MKTKEEYSELYYGKENLMGEKSDLMRIPELEVGREERHMDMEKANAEMEKNKGEERPMVNDAKVKKVKPKRFHVDLSPEMGQDLSDLAEKMGLTLNAVVKLFLMDDWQKLKVSGFDYIYLGIADRPKAPGEIPF